MSAPAVPASAASTAPAVQGQGAQRFSHSGERYVLGYGDGFFGIWDRGLPGGPVYSAPRTDDGWQELWERFVALEPRAVEVPPPGGGGAPGGGSGWGGYGGPSVAAVDAVSAFRSGRVLARWVAALLVAVAVIALIAIVFRIVEYGLIHQVETAGGSPDLAVRLRSSADRLDAITSLLSAGVIATGVVWLVWQFRVRRNLDSLGVSAKLRYSAGWNVGWWFIPFANLVMPCLTMLENDRESVPRPQAGRRTSVLVLSWWAALLVQYVLYVVGGSIAQDASATLSEHSARQVVGSFASLAMIVAAGLAVALVLRIDRNQEARRASLPGWEAAHA
jgi:hypothetical protein